MSFWSWIRDGYGANARNGKFDWSDILLPFNGSAISNLITSNTDLVTSNDEIREMQKEEREAQESFATSSAEKANEFTAEQAQFNREWQEKMSSTAYQRAVSDMKAAGLNPALLFTNGQAASTPGGASGSGAMASVNQADLKDTSTTDILTSLLSGILTAFVISGRSKR